MSLRIRQGTIGGHHASAANDSALNIAGAYTISCNVMFTRLPASGETFALVTKGTPTASSDANYWFSFRNDGGTLEWYHAHVETTGGVLEDIQVPFTPAIGKWYAVYVSYTGTGFNLAYTQRGASTAPTAYGSLNVTASVTTPATSTLSLRIGAGINAAGTLDHGGDVALDEVALYDAQIAEATLEGRLGTRLNGDETNLVGYWPLDENKGGAGGFAYDRTGNGNDLTLQGMPYWIDAPQDLKYSTGLVDGAFIAGPSWTSSVQTTMSATTEATDYDIEALYSPAPSETTRTTADTLTRYVFDFKRAVPVAMVYVDGHNLTSAATITVELAKTNSWPGAITPEAMTFHPDSLIHFFARPYSYRFARLSITDAANPDTYIELGRVAWMPIAVQFPKSGPLSHQGDQAIDASVAVETLHGSRSVRTEDVRRTRSIGLGCVRRDDAYAVRRISAIVGDSEPLFVCSDSGRDLRRRGVYGRISGFASENPTTTWKHVNLGPITIEEGAQP